MTIMLDPVGAIEDALIARLQETFVRPNGRSLLKEIKPIEVPIDAGATKEFKTNPPALYVLPLTMRPGPVAGALNVYFSAYAMAKDARSKRVDGEIQGLTIGTYAIATRTALAIEEWRPKELDGVGTFTLLGIENLAGLKLAARGVNCWAVTMMTTVSANQTHPTDGLEDFITYATGLDGVQKIPSQTMEFPDD